MFARTSAGSGFTGTSQMKVWSIFVTTSTYPTTLFPPLYVRNNLPVHPALQVADLDQTGLVAEEGLMESVGDMKVIRRLVVLLENFSHLFVEAVVTVANLGLLKVVAMVVAEVVVILVVTVEIMEAVAVVDIEEIEEIEEKAEVLEEIEEKVVVLVVVVAVALAVAVALDVVHHHHNNKNEEPKIILLDNKPYVVQ